MSDKRPLMLWSGGLDSTWMLWQALQKGDVDFVTVDGGQCRNKQRSERHARSRAMRWMHARTKYRAREIESQVKLHLAEMPALTWSQPVPWLIGALSVIDPKRHSSLEVGYVMGDEVNAVFEALKRTWEGLQQISKHGDTVPLNFPLGWTSKRRILENIPKGLYDCIWYCELPKKHDDPRVLLRVPCERCVACITHKTELYRYSLYHTDGWGIGKYDPEVLSTYGPGDRCLNKPESTPETLYVYLPITDRHHMDAVSDQPYTLLPEQVAYSTYDTVDALKHDGVINSSEHHILGLQFHQPFSDHVEEIAPGVFNLNRPVLSEEIFAVYSTYGDRLLPKEPDAWCGSKFDSRPTEVDETTVPSCAAARRLLDATLNDSVVTEVTKDARLSLHEPSAVQESQEDECAAQSA